jgi:hypothetical protein
MSSKAEAIEAEDKRQRRIITRNLGNRPNFNGPGES